MAEHPPLDISTRLPVPGGRGRYLVAFSGGLDSTVLLHLLSRLHPSRPVQAVHVNHGLQPAAQHWPAHCRRFCQSLGIPLTVLEVAPAQGAGQSLEAEARRARYGALQAILRQGDVLLTAHHLDDQAETLLLQLLRGAGPRGLAAMPVLCALPPGQLARPLLDYPRSALAAYARAHALDWVEDPSNDDSRHARNFLRRELLPVLRQRWPEWASTLGRSAILCAEAAEMLDQQARSDWQSCAGPQAASLSVSALKRLDPARRRNLLRAWLGWNGLPLPEEQHLRRVDKECLDAAVDATPLLRWPGAELRRYRETLFAMPVLPEPIDDWRSGWCLDQALQLPPGCGVLAAEPVNGQGLRSPGSAEQVTVRLAQDGELLQLPGRQHRSALKTLCQAAGIPPWLRRRLPVILYNDQVAAIAGHWVCAGFDSAGEGPAWRLHWRNAPPGYPLA